VPPAAPARSVLLFVETWEKDKKSASAAFPTHVEISQAAGEYRLDGSLLECIAAANERGFNEGVHFMTAASAAATPLAVAAAAAPGPEDTAEDDDVGEEHEHG